MSISSIRRVYNIYAWFYDYVFGRIFHPGRHLSTDIVNKNVAQNAKVLELGVGTGLSLPLYRADLNITGIDISEKMLNKAKARLIDDGIEATISLKVMDAANLDFPDNTFDVIVAMYVASVVPDVQVFLKEISRVCKPTGEIVFVNHFASDKPFIRFFENKFARFHKIIGFKSDFSINSILDYKRFKVVECHKTNLFGYWKVLRCKQT